MDYRRKWNSLRERLESTVNDGKERCFDQDPNTLEGAMFNAFSAILRDMNEMDAECYKGELKNCVQIDYEAECKRLTDESNCMKEKLFHTEEKAKFLYEENRILEAKMSVVNLIFGKD